MIQRGTFLDAAISIFQWQVSRLASRWIGEPVKRYYIVLFFLICIPIMLARINFNPRSVIWSDAEGYYQYLPALFIIKDVHALPPGSVWPYYNDKGEYVDKYTSGVAIFELAFFLLAYVLSDAAGFDKLDYFNPLYCRAMAVSGLFFAFWGLWLMRIVLLRYVSSTITFWVVVSVFFGTNLFHYATREMSVAHVYNFFLFALLLYLLPFYLKKPNWKNSIAVGAILGWITLIRPTNCMVGLLFLLYDVYSWKALLGRIQFYLHHPGTILWIAAGAFLLFIPQLCYWKELTGEWIYYSYTDEGFRYWNQPKIAAVLFDVQNGLFLYSPLVLLMVAGIAYGLIKKCFQAPVMLLLFLIATYVFASWWAWWFGGAFGHRCYVEFYALFALPLAGLYQWVFSKRRRLWKTAFYALVVFLMAFSVRLSYLYTSLPGPWDGADWRWNWEKYEGVLSHLLPN